MTHVVERGTTGLVFTAANALDFFGLRSGVACSVAYRSSLSDEQTVSAMVV